VKYICDRKSCNQMVFA